jgi:hypothetical protein
VGLHNKEVEMKKGTVAAAPTSKPVEGKKDTSKPKGGKVFFGLMPAGRKGRNV